MSPTVVIDPGHGGAAMVGGSSPNNASGPNGLLEKDVTLDLARRVSALLTGKATVILTRTGDTNLGLADRAKIAHDNNADILLSIHLNGWSDPTVDGSEAWVATHAGAPSRALARSVLDQILTVTHVRDRGVKQEDFGVLLPQRLAASTAATLVEVAFLTNPDEADKLSREEYKQQLAQAIATALTTQLPAPPTTDGGVAQSLSFGSLPGAGTIFLAPNITNTYTDFIQPVTRGDLEPLINGRSSNPPVDKTEPLDQMQAIVSTTTEGDSVYLAAWYFDPTTQLTGGPYLGKVTWGGFLAKKAAEGVKVRILQTDFDAIAGASRANIRTWLGLIDRYIAALPADKQDNLQYVVSMQPVTYTGRALFKGRTSINIGSHHQKFMVVKRGQETIAFCGGLDIESRKTPARWGYSANQLAGWHDIHVKMRGPIARDLEKEFALRWNRESGSSTLAPSPNPWSALATLPVPSDAVDGDTDAEADRQQEDVQMERTVSSDATIGFTTNQDNVKQIYNRIVKASETFLYFENQYFRSLDLADWIVAAGQANTSMPVIFVVVFSAATDDGNDEVTQQGTYLQHEFFDRVVKALGSRAAIYTMTSRAVHSKFVLGDDRYMTIGSANANERSFQLDSELNVAVDDSKLAAAFRKRLWAHNLGVSEATVGAWGISDFITQWDAVATANAALAPQDMAGEGVVRWDYTQATGDSHVYIPDYLADTDSDHGDEPNRGGLLAVNDAGSPEDTSTDGDTATV